MTTALSSVVIVDRSVYILALSMGLLASKCAFLLKGRLSSAAFICATALEFVLDRPYNGSVCLLFGSEIARNR